MVRFNDMQCAHSAIPYAKKSSNDGHQISEGAGPQQNTVIPPSMHGVSYGLRGVPREVHCNSAEVPRERRAGAADRGYVKANPSQPTARPRSRPPLSSRQWRTKNSSGGGVGGNTNLFTDDGSNKACWTVDENGAQSAPRQPHPNGEGGKPFVTSRLFVARLWMTA